MDHTGLKDHYRDQAVPRFALLNLIGLCRRAQSVTETARTAREVVRSLVSQRYDSWRCVEQWMALETERGIRSTWFVACRPGRGIAYTPVRARSVVEVLVRHGCTVGLHSQCRDNPDGLPAELAEFRAAYGIAGPVPLRMHYMIPDATPLRRFADLFTYDSSDFGEDRFAASDEFERPVNIMDTYFFCPIRRMLTFAEARERTCRLIEAARRQGRQITFDLHHRSLSPTLPRYREYILWLYDELPRCRD
jgi:hypothetical protein